MHVHTLIQDAVARTCTALYGDDLPAAALRLPVAPPKNPDHGDYALTTAMALAPALGRDRISVAREIAAALPAELPGYAFSIAGPGFINVKLPETALMQICTAATDQDYGTQHHAGHVILEFGSANPTGPLHVGHARGLVIGSALASVMRAAGHQVTTEYYVNDAGAQIAELSASVLTRAREALGLLPEGQPVPYPGDYTRAIGHALAQHDPALVKSAVAEDMRAGGAVANFAIRSCMDMILTDLDRLGVSYDAFISEAAIDDAAFTARVTGWESAGLVKTQTPPPLLGKPAGAPVPMFLSSQFGDDQDRVLVKSSGERTYFGNDAVNHARKAEAADHVITVLGEDHAGYVARIAAVVKAVNPDARMSAPLVRMVHLMRDGQPVSMSKRAGTFETLADLLDAVPPAVVRMSMLTRGPDSTITFDLAAAAAEGPTNPVWGVNYAYARLGSALAKIDADALTGASPTGPMSAPERRVAQIVADWPRVLQGAAESLEPHRIANYARDLADAVNGWWSAGHQDPSVRLVQPDDPEGTLRRSQVAMAARATLHRSLGTIGIVPEERMERAPENAPEL